MCILFIHVDPTPAENGYRLIVATNRDEYYSRPAEPAFHCQKSNIIGGRDMGEGREGGMWFGISLNKTDEYIMRLACILNVTGEEHSRDAEGRGAIVLNYLNEQIQTEDYKKLLLNHSYNAFNLVTIELSKENALTFHQSNRPPSCYEYTGKQFLAFGNSTVNEPLQKVLKGKAKFEEIIRQHGTGSKEELVEQLTRLLKHKERFLPDPELQRRSTIYELLSSIYVKVVEGHYGTRAHSIVLIDYDWNVDFIEIALEEPIDVERSVWKTRRFKARL